MPNAKQELINAIARARAAGRVVIVDPPITPADLVGLAARCGTPPPDIQEFAEYSAGFSVDGFAMSICADQPFEFEQIFACAVAIATDGRGNFWVVDVSANGAWGAIFFIAHDPPVAFVQARDLESFVAQIADGRVISIKDNAVALIASENPYVLSRADALASADSVLRAFAELLSDSFVIADMRDLELGKGFVWGAAGPNTEVRRAGEELLFAIERRKRGMLERLFLGS